MAHNIDMSNGQANIAFLGNRADVWHRLGQEMQPGMDIPAWAKASGQRCGEYGRPLRQQEAA